MGVCVSWWTRAEVTVCVCVCVVVDAGGSDGVWVCVFVCVRLSVR